MTVFNESWEAVIGLEIHVQLATNSKLFSGASTNFGALPNTQACNIDLALPGVLPVLNEEVLKMAVKLGKALNANFNSPTSFARKNYFYPDSPKGYQISQMDKPIVEDGFLDIELEDGTSKRIGVTRAHLEEDAGKSLHEDFEGQSGIDLNRAGTPLIEIVSEPDINSPEEAVAYLKSIHSIIRYLEISDGNMAEGSMRCDANVSVRKIGSDELGTRTETKNVNSFRFVEKAIQYEIERQISEIESGNTITQETRLYDSQANTTRPMRTKEYANDYRYFPEPDLLPVVLEDKFIKTMRKAVKNDSMYSYSRSIVNKKDENNVEIISNNKPVKCDISDVPMLIANIEKEISSIEKQLSTAGERKYKELKSQQIIDDMANQRKITGESVEELVEKFDISMKLLKLRD